MSTARDVVPMELIAVDAMLEAGLDAFVRALLQQDERMVRDLKRAINTALAERSGQRAEEDERAHVDAVLRARWMARLGNPADLRSGVRSDAPVHRIVESNRKTKTALAACGWRAIACEVVALDGPGGRICLCCERSTTYKSIRRRARHDRKRKRRRGRAN